MTQMKPFADYLRTEIPNLVENKDELTISNFDHKKIMKYYGEIFDPSNVIALVDEGTFSKYHNRICFTNNAIYFTSRKTKVIRIKYSDIKGTYIQKGRDYINIDVNDELFELNWGKNIKNRKLIHFFQKIRTYCNNEQINETDQAQTIEDLSQEARFKYTQILVNLTYEDDKLIDAQELSEIHLIMAQIKLDSKWRSDIINYIQLHDKDLDVLWEDLCDSVPNGAERSIAMSLMKDMIRIDNLTQDNETAFDNPFIMRFKKLTHIEKIQMEGIEEANNLEQKFISGEINENEFKSGIEQITKTSFSIGLPLTAIWFSGSVTGLSITGITSGLASIGMVGLGMGSMLSGSGVAIASGLAIYKGFDKLFKFKGEEAPSRRRELLIKKIMEMNQFALRNISEDIRIIGENLIKLTEEVNINREKITDIQKQFSLYIASMDDRSKGANYAE